MDLIDLIQEKRFIGQEFLAWLWFKSEERGGSIALADGSGDIQLAFEKHMLLEYGEGEIQERLVCRGLQTELREARAGMALGKKPDQARIRLVHHDREFGVTLSGATLEFRSVRLPKTMSEAEEETGPEAMEARLLERISLVEELAGLIDGLLRQFLILRVGPAWPEEQARLRSWIGKGLMEG